MLDSLLQFHLELLVFFFFFGLALVLQEKHPMIKKSGELRNELGEYCP